MTERNHFSHRCYADLSPGDVVLKDTGHTQVVLRRAETEPPWQVILTWLTVETGAIWNWYYSDWRQLGYDNAREG